MDSSYQYTITFPTFMEGFRVCEGSKPADMLIGKSSLKIPIYVHASNLLFFLSQASFIALHFQCHHWPSTTIKTQGL